MFWRHRAAVSWARRREVELEDPSTLARAQAEKTPLAELIRWYIDQFHAIAQWQRSKQSALELLERHEIGREDVYRLSASRLVQHVRSRRLLSAGPATAQTDLIYTGVVLEVADRVRDLKHPQHTIGNDRRFRYTPESWQIALRQPRTGALMFPYKPQGIKAAFNRACRRLGIDNLHFHDLRHEATSRLFERGYEIHEVQQFTVHSSWQHLKRYTHLRPQQIPDLPYPPSDTQSVWGRPRSCRPQLDTMSLP
jgi:integrase